ncbi:MAG: MarC family protein [Candidatus Ranarchaeia archaeon]
MLEYLIGQSLLTLFIVLDPIGAVPFFEGLTTKLGHNEKKKVARLTVLIASILLLLFAFLGFYLLLYLGINIAHFQIAGGIFLFVFALNDAISGKPIGIDSSFDYSNVSAFPLATPLLAGPGSISVVLLISNMPYGLILSPLSIIVNCFLTWVIFRGSSKLTKVFNPQNLIVLGKLMDVIMGALAISFITQGISAIFLL